MLNGDVVNTNSLWLGQRLRSAGLTCTSMITVSDRKSEILRVLRFLWDDHDLIVLTGGLGPTHDDVTKSALLEFFDDKPKRNEKVLKHVLAYFKRKGRDATDVNRQQADVPSKARILFNELGTAPGILMEQMGKILVALPGVPYEMRYITEKRLIPEIEKRWHESERRIQQHYFRTTGIGESELSDRIIKNQHHRIPKTVDIAFLPHPMGVDLRVTEVDGESGNGFNELVGWIRKAAGEFIFSEKYKETLACLIVTLLTKYQKTVSFAESCTGGFLSNAITDIPGSSNCFRGGIIAYDNRVKTEFTGVASGTIEQHGAVSAAVALELAKKTGETMETDFAVSTTGVAGPGGGSEDKPVGTVWIGFWSRSGQHFACRYLFSSERLINKERSCAAGLEILRRQILNIKGLPNHPEVVRT